MHASMLFHWMRLDAHSGISWKHIYIYLYLSLCIYIYTHCVTLYHTILYIMLYQLYIGVYIYI